MIERASGLPLVGARLSPAARLVWAKHDEKTQAWLPLWRHLADSAAVTRLLWDEWVPANVRGLLAEAVGGKDEDARALAVWLAATHDIGKATPAFACQVVGLADRMRDAGLAMPTAKQFGDDRRMAPHGLAGQLLIQEWLEGSPRVAAAGCWAVRGRGRGGPRGAAGVSQIHDLDLRADLLRTPGESEALWRSVQFELLDVWTAECGMDGALAVLRTVRLPQPAQVLLTGLVIMADWIASNPELFPYFPEERPRSEAERVTAAWRGLQLPPLWEPSEPQGTAAGLLLSRFDLPPTARPRPVQEQAVALARELPSPGLMVIEAPMGEGKTEAALAVAEIFAARRGAGGCFVALPTRATSNAMFSRLTTWLDHLPGNGERAVFLAHAKASLHDEYAGLMRAGRRQIEAVDVDGPHHSHEDGNGDGDKDGRARQRPGGGRHPQSRNAGLIAHQWLPPTARSACAVC